MPVLAFALGLSTTTANLTGDGAVVPIPFDTVDFDEGDSFPAGAGSVFTCVTPGIYWFDLSVGVTGVFVEDNTQLSVSLQQAGSADLTYFGMANPWASNSGGVVMAQTTAMIQLEEGDTVTCQFSVGGTDKNSAAYASISSARYTSFTGALIG